MEALDGGDFKAGGANEGFGVAVGMAAAGAGAPEGQQTILAGAEWGAGGSGHVFEKNEDAAWAEGAEEGGEGGSGIGQAAENQCGEDGVIVAGLAGVGGGVESGAGGKRDGSGQPAVGLVAGPGDAGGEVAEVDAMAGADLENAAGKVGEPSLLAGVDEGLMKAAGEPHEESKPHLFEFDGDGAVRLSAFVGELGGGFALVVPDNFAGLAVADGELTCDRIFALIGTIVEEDDDLIGGADVGRAGHAGEISGVKDPDFGVFESGFDGKGGGEKRSRHKSG